MSVTQVSHGGQLYAEAAKQGLTEQQALEKWIDFSASIPPWTFRPTAPLNELALQHYPDANHAELMHALQQRFQIAPEYISVCNGVSSAILNLFAYLRPKQTTLYAPIFGEYEKVAAAYGSQIQRINRLKDASLTPYSISDLAKIPVAKNSLVIWVNPSTPDGQHTDLESMKPLLDLWKQQNCLVVLDESFLPFIGFDTKLSGRSLLETWPKLIILQSLTKYYACPGLRVGAVFAHPDFLSQWPQAHWPISIVDQKILLQRLNEPSLETQNQALQTQLKPELIEQLQNSPLVERIYPSSVNFILLKTTIKAQYIAQVLLKQGILVRDCESFGLGPYRLRIAVKDRDCQQRLVEGWKKLESEYSDADI